VPAVELRPSEVAPPQPRQDDRVQGAAHATARGALRQEVENSLTLFAGKPGGLVERNNRAIEKILHQALSLRRTEIV
jgi:hypothetical protein